MDNTEYSCQSRFDETWVSCLLNLRKQKTNGDRFVSRTNPRSPNDHVILGVLGYKPKDFATQMNLNLANGWGIVRTIVDMVLKMDDGKYILVKDPNKSVLRLYAVPSEFFDEEESVADKAEAGDADDEE